MEEFDPNLIFREWDTYDLGADAAIDQYKLDKAAVRQSEFMCKWIELLVVAQSKFNTAKEALSNVEAELTLTAKTNGIPGNSKPSDVTVKAWVTVQPGYKRALRTRNVAENNVNYLQNARTVLEHRKSMIKVLSDLHITGYFSKPSKAIVEKSTTEEHKAILAESMRKRHLREDK